MNIGFDAKRYCHNKSGLGNYSRDLINTLVRLYPGDRFFLFEQHPVNTELPANAVYATPASGRPFWRILGIKKEISMYKIDVFHGLSNELPFGKWPSAIKKVVTVHDVIFREYPAHYTPVDRMIYHIKTRHAVKSADRIIVTSKASATSLQKYYKIDPLKIKVVYQTCGAAHCKQYPKEDIERFRIKRQLPESFVLYVSSFQTRKNHLSLLHALTSGQSGQVNIVLSGRQGETLKACQSFVKENGLERRVRFLTDVSDAELPLLYRAATAFVYPSMAEGFGIPLIEAAQAGLPIAVNDIPVFRELAPHGSLFFNAADADAFARTIQMVSGMPKQIHTTYLEQFSQAFAAEAVYAVYRECFTGQ